MNSNLIIERNDHIAILKVNRPEALNVLNQETLSQILEFLTNTARKEGYKAVILAGEGKKAFIAGADIKEMQAMTHIQMLQFCELGQQVASALENSPFLTIAAVNGFALGGGLEMALACDFIYASKNAKMGLPEVKLGIIPGFGGTQRLSRAIGTRKAKELVMSGRMISAETALEMGIVNKVCEEDSLLEEVQQVAKEITQNSFLAIMQAKRAIDKGNSMGLTEALELEKNMCAVCFSTSERLEAMNAFLSKRSR